MAELLSVNGGLAVRAGGLVDDSAGPACCCEGPEGCAGVCDPCSECYQVDFSGLGVNCACFIGECIGPWLNMEGSAIAFRPQIQPPVLCDIDWDCPFGSGPCGLAMGTCHDSDGNPHEGRFMSMNARIGCGHFDDGDYWVVFLSNSCCQATSLYRKILDPDSPCPPSGNYDPFTGSPPFGTVTVTPILCPTETEACCFQVDSVGGCIDAFPSVCSGAGGMPQGSGSTCDSTNCPGEPEACCLPDGSCVQATSSDCARAGGTSQGPGTTCGSIQCPPEACCLPDGTCLELLPFMCTQQGGVPQGPGTTCGVDPCDEACCFPNGQCADMPPGQCSQQGGTPQGPGTECGVNVDCTSCSSIAGCCILTCPQTLHVMFGYTYPDPSFPGPFCDHPLLQAFGEGDVQKVGSECHWRGVFIPGFFFPGGGGGANAQFTVDIVCSDGDVPNGTCAQCDNATCTDPLPIVMHVEGTYAQPGHPPCPFTYDLVAQLGNTGGCGYFAEDPPGADFRVNGQPASASLILQAACTSSEGWRIAALVSVNLPNPPGCPADSGVPSGQFVFHRPVTIGETCHPMGPYAWVVDHPTFTTITSATLSVAAPSPGPLGGGSGVQPVPVGVGACGAPHWRAFIEGVSAIGNADVGTCKPVSSPPGGCCPIGTYEIVWYPAECKSCPPGVCAVSLVVEEP